MAPTDSLSQVEPHLVATASGTLLTAYLRFTPEPSARTGFFSSPGRYSCESRVSHDDGRNWLPLRLPFGSGHCGDPWLVADPDGGAYLVVSGQGVDDAVTRLLRWEGGPAWRVVEEMREPLDHPTLALHGDTVIVAGSHIDGHVVVLRISPDSDTVDRSEVDPDRHVHAGPPMITHAGRLLLPFTDFEERTWVASSDDGGRSFTRPALVTETCGRAFFDTAATLDALYIACRDEGERLRVLESRDGGGSWTTRWSGNAGPAGTPVVAVAADGRALVAWQERRRPDGCAILRGVILSDDATDPEPSVLEHGADCSGKRPLHVADRFPWGGDYMAATWTGREFAVAWSRRDGERYQVEVVRIP